MRGQSLLLRHRLSVSVSVAAAASVAAADCAAAQSQHCLTYACNNGSPDLRKMAPVRSQERVAPSFLRSALFRKSGRRAIMS